MPSSNLGTSKRSDTLPYYIIEFKPDVPNSLAKILKNILFRSMHLLRHIEECKKDLPEEFLDSRPTFSKFTPKKGKILRGDLFRIFRESF